MHEWILSFDESMHLSKGTSGVQVKRKGGRVTGASRGMVHLGRESVKTWIQSSSWDRQRKRPYTFNSNKKKREGDLAFGPDLIEEVSSCSTKNERRKSKNGHKAKKVHKPIIECTTGRQVLVP